MLSSTDWPGVSADEDWALEEHPCKSKTP
jgi:hypothetical protein